MIVRRLKDVEKIDVGKAFGAPDNFLVIQWIISNEVGDERYRHAYAFRKYTMQPGAPLELVPFHSHNYVQSPHIISGTMIFQNAEGEPVEVGPGDTVYFYANEPHRGTVKGDQPVELYCIIDCPGGGEDCLPEVPKTITCGC